MSVGLDLDCKQGRYKKQGSLYFNAWKKLWSQHTGREKGSYHGRGSGKGTGKFWWRQGLFFIYSCQGEIFGSSYSGGNKLEACHNQHKMGIFLGNLFLISPHARGSGRIMLFSARALAQRQVPLTRKSWTSLVTGIMGSLLKKMLHDPLPFAISLCLCLFCWVLCSVNQSNSHRARSCGSKGVSLVKRSRWWAAIHGSQDAHATSLREFLLQCWAQSWWFQNICWLTDRFMVG